MRLETGSTSKNLSIKGNIQTLIMAGRHRYKDISDVLRPTEKEQTNGQRNPTLRTIVRIIIGILQYAQ